MDDRRSHWPIYDVVPMEMIKIVAETVRKALPEAPKGVVESKNGMVVYFLSDKEKSLNRREK